MHTFMSNFFALISTVPIPIQLVVAFCAKQEQQLHHQQLTNGSTILFTFTFPVNLDLFNLSTVFFGSILAKLSLSDPHSRRCLALRFWEVVVNSGTDPKVN